MRIMKELKLNKKIVACLDQVTGGKDYTNTCPSPPIPVSNPMPTVKVADCQSNGCAPTEQNTIGPTTCESIVMCTVYLC